MNDALRKQINDNLELRETEELLDIWQTNDRLEWSDTAYEVLREILTKRLGQVPPQNEPIREHPEGDKEELEDWEAKLLDRDDQPELYDPIDVLMLGDHVNKTAWAVIVVNVLTALLSFQPTQSLIEGHLPSISDLANVGITFPLLVLTTGLGIAVVYFPLKALVQVLRILMEMEFNSHTKAQ